MEPKDEKIDTASIIVIPDRFPFPKKGRFEFDIDRNLEEFKARDEWTAKGMYAFVSWEWVAPLAKWIGPKRVLEVMAGAGWLSKALRSKGIEVIATDDYSWIEKRDWDLQTNVERLAAVQAIEKYGASSDILVMSWPYMDSTAFEALRKWEEVNSGAPVIYIGESDGGCTADYNFFAHFEEIEDDSFAVVSRNYRSWCGIHDHLNLGKYKSE